MREVGFCLSRECIGGAASMHSRERQGEQILTACAYCNERRGVTWDHVIPQSVRRKLWGMPRFERNAWRRPWVKRGTTEEIDMALLGTVIACFECNVAKGARLLVPPSWSDRLDELNDLGIGKFREWDGNPEMLRTVHK